MKHRRIQLLVITTAATAWAVLMAVEPERQWFAGDSRIHSHWSADYDETRNPPEPIVGVDGRYATPINAHHARMNGLSWMVTTDHGGPNHSKLNLTRAYAELTSSREMVREVDRNPTTRVLSRFSEKQWTRAGDAFTFSTTLPGSERDSYVRIRGTNTMDAEPPMDVVGENPWADLWFYSNPIFVESGN